MTGTKWPRTGEQRAKRDARVKAWATANRLKLRANYKRWYHKHGDQVREESRERYKNRSTHVERLERNSHYKSRYGITVAEYESLLVKQNGACAICRTKKAGRKGQHFAVDHCHESGVVRGLLCINCNARIGWLNWYRDYGRAIDAYLCRSEAQVA